MLDLLASLFTVKALLAAVLLVLVMEYISLKRKRQSLPGPKYWLPFLGKTIEMVSDPVHFYHTYQTNFGPISWTQLMGKFVVFTTDTELTRKVFTNTAGKLRLFLVFTAEKILGKNNIAFMHGPEHKELRKQLLPLFTPKALKVYLNLQEDIIRATLARWAKELQGTTQEIRTRVRDLNVETSTKVFLGKYMNDEQRAGFNVDYGMLNEGMMSLPIELPGTTYWKAIQARKKIVKMLTSCVVQSKAAMKDKNAPHCLLDFWMEEQMRLIEESQAHNEPLPTHTSDYEIACVVLDFLFASQDASTASLVWTFHLTDRHPEVLKRVRQEQQLVRPNDEPLTHELIKEMGYTRQVVKEILRFRPPASMVPHIAVDDFKISDDYTVPKGTIILPSVWAAQMEGYTKPESFDPDRFSDARAEEVKFGKHWLVFGTGAHMCLGKEYAMNHLTAFLAILASNYTWKCERTALSEEVVFGPTIFPADGCVLSLTA